MMGYVRNLGSLGEQVQRLVGCLEDAVHRLELVAADQKKSQVISGSIRSRTLDGVVTSTSNLQTLGVAVGGT